ncbi:MAG: DUF1559 domain-containing protein [Planctomycetales bacterium]
MVAYRQARGFTPIELITVFIAVFVLLSTVLPSVSTVRESSRRSTCTANQKQISLAIKTFEEKYKHNPPSAYRVDDNGSDTYIGNNADTIISKVVPASAGASGTAAPYSMFVKVLPFMEHGDLYERIDFSESTFGPTQKKNVANVVIPQLVCPANSGKISINEAPYDIFNAAVTNYKSFGATDRETLDNPELVMASTVEVQDGIGNGGGMHHPYGTVRAPKATSLTFQTTETRERRLASWYDGTTVALFGIVDDSGTRKVGLNNQWSEMPASAIYATFGGGHAMTWGPSSEHPGVTVHSFADGSARGIQDEIPLDVFGPLITKASNDNAFALDYGG